MQNLEDRIRDLETENDHLLKKLKAYLAIGPLEKIVNIDDIKPAIKKAVDKNFKDLQNILQRTYPGIHNYDSHE